jgi:uncharacterized short protein YbdD (DUF466 family)
MKTSATNKKIRELISAVSEKSLVPRPEFQRRLVWTMEDKNKFLETVLMGFPFPEIYVADGDVDTETAKGTQLLVDGQQRVSTLCQYFSGDPKLVLKSVRPYAQLDEEERKRFLGYDVAVRDLGSVTKEQVLEVFQRINATSYSLNEMEINNAIYAGALKKFGDSICEIDFFENHGTFRVSDLRRMGDLRYVLTIVISMMSGYFNRDDELESKLQQYNDDFPYERDMRNRLQRVLDFIDECGFSNKSRIWKKADLFTVIVEVDRFYVEEKRDLQPSDVVKTLEEFYSKVDEAAGEGGGAVSTYYKAALQASNDRINRIRRGVVVAALLRRQDPDVAAVAFN